MRAALLVVFSLGLFACGGGSVPGTVEVSLTSAGATPSVQSAPSAGKVHFVNHDTVDHQIASTDCPSIASPKLSPGADFTGALPAGPKVCTFSDSLHPSDTKFQGQVTVASPTPGGSGSGY